MKNRLTIIIIAAALIICLGAGYLIYNYLYLPSEIAAANARYAALYSPTALPQPTLAPDVTVAPAPTAALPAPDDIKLGTPDPSTLVLAAATLPPVQESFAGLMEVNPETVAFLRLGELELPVAQRANDNEHYLTHDFEGNESTAGCLFLDGANWLFPRDDVLYVYGHNMKNGEMFGHLTRMATVKGLIASSPAYFDTIYENGVYIPFACFALSADDADRDYLKLREFSFTQESFTEYVASLKKHSLLDIPVDAVYGDKLLILVTCNYSISDGRFAVAFRQLREGETEEGALRLVRLAVEK